MVLRTFFVALLSISFMNGQELPYHQIPEYPEDYGSWKHVVGRMIDGLGLSLSIGLPKV